MNDSLRRADADDAPDGAPTNIADWLRAHRERRAAEVANGERCAECGTRTFGASGSPRTCQECQSLRSESGEVDSDTHIRCPHCGHITSVVDADLWEIGIDSDGEHNVHCESCDARFTVTTYVTSTYTSPPLVTEDADEEAEDDD
jgi:DNA-directed RNA polymerase subunit RPC12/RpoP